jgi:virginiamycin A acetyltransferase
VVVSDVPPYAIVGGNPAKVIKHRFSADEVAMLAPIAWWDWPVEHFSANLDAIVAGDVAALQRRAPATPSY